MSVFDHPDFDDHEQVVFFSDPAVGLRAIVAIHSTAPYGIAGGGCRFWSYSTSDEALRDALRLSKAMSYKLALCDMPAGGAKSVIIGDSHSQKTEGLLRAMGRFVERLSGKYIIAEDVGTTEADMRIIGSETKYVVGRHTDTGPATAYGTFLGLRLAARRKLGRESLKGVRVAVQGLGGVGRRLCKHLHDAGAELIVCDLDAAAVARVTADFGARAVAPEVILEQEVDVLAPCALGSILDDTSIPKLRCQVIAGAANNQLAEERHAQALAARGILFAPDFILNAGGVIGASQEGKNLGAGGDPTAYDESIAFKETRIIEELLGTAMTLAEREHLTPHAAAVRMAKDKLRSRSSG
jgi:leucine dehydrogenase